MLKKTGAILLICGSISGCLFNSYPEYPCFFDAGAICWNDPQPINHNLLLLQVSEGGFVRFSETIYGSSIYNQCSKDVIQFSNNSLGIDKIILHSLDGSYCGARLHFTDRSYYPINGTIDGDINTFTEIVAGKYRFVPVR